MILRNQEGKTEYNIDSDWHSDREYGVSAMLRVGNEEEWIGPCLESILNFFDEIVITVDCDDRTLKVIESFNSPKIAVYEYPFDINPNGPGHDDYPVDSVHDRAYYYNWSLSKTTMTHVSKWDADMIMLPEFATDEFKRRVLNSNIVKTSGWEVVDREFDQISTQNPTTGKEVRFFEVTPRLYYEQGEFCENFTYPSPSQIIDKPLLSAYRLWNIVSNKELHIEEPTYLHTKHIKSSDKQAWPDNWEELDHFREINSRKESGQLLDVSIPNCCFKSVEDYISTDE